MSKLTSHQEEVFNQIWDFIKSDSPGVFILNGYAGTGKTFLLQYIAEKLNKERIDFSLLASTGRASAVLRGKTSMQAKTIHSFIYLFSAVDGAEKDLALDAKYNEYGSMGLLFDLRAPDDSKKIPPVIIVDEASMVGDLKNNSGSFAKFGSGQLLSDMMSVMSKSKVIISGDIAQLPPVGEDSSPALMESWYREKNINVLSSSLTEVLRHEEKDDILTLSIRMRNMLDLNFFQEWLRLPLQGLNNIASFSWNIMLDKYWEHVNSKGFKGTIAISNSNNNCLFINNFIREKRYGKREAYLQKGEILMVTQNNGIYNLVNGDFIEVVEILDEHSHIGLKFLNIKIRALDSLLEHNVLLCYNTLTQSKGNLTENQQKQLMIDFTVRMKSEGIKSGSPRYYMLLKEDIYLNSLRASYGYAVTCHKSQGGEWDNVYIFVNKGLSKPQTSQTEAIRWWYTAITRAKKRVVIADGWWLRRY